MNTAALAKPPIGVEPLDETVYPVGRKPARVDFPDTSAPAARAAAAQNARGETGLDATVPLHSGSRA